MSLTAGLVGHPVAHSRSPQIFADLSARVGRPVRYSLFDVPPEGLAEFLGRTALALDGFNVTAPHKEAIHRACAHLTPLARAVGAVNAVRRRPDGSLEGENTDVAGFAAALGGNVPRRAAVIGAGGAARAVVICLKQLGCSTIRVLARRPERAAGLCADSGLEPALGLDDLSLATAFTGADLVVQATSAVELAEQVALPWERLGPEALAIDLLYRPTPTAFLGQADAAGVRAMDGLPMLAGQAVAALRFFRPDWPIEEPDRWAEEIGARLRAGVD